MTLMNGTDWTSSDFANGAHRTNFPEAVFDDFLAEAEIQIAAVGSALTATSSSSVSVGTGSKTFTVGASKGFATGLWLVAFRTSDPTAYMLGPVTGYSGGDVTISVASGNSAGSGTFTDWTIGVGGQRGPAGDMTGPGSATDNAWARYDGAGGATLQDGQWVEADSGAVTAGGALDMADNALTRALVSDLAEDVHAIGTLPAGTTDIDLTEGPVQTLTGAVETVTLTISNWPGSGAGTVVLAITNGGLCSAITWPVDQWIGGGDPPDLTASGVDLVAISRVGGVRYGYFALDFQA
ncbi:MAG: hypothetical protein RIB84_23930 [Sneathiellaceae bacterium]